MTLAEGVLAIMWLGLTAYAVLGGADFGGGVWDLLAGGAERGATQRTLIERALGPVWEANHVWLIFVLVVLWTGFPSAFAPLMSTLYVPLTVAAVGVILRGAGFAFRKSVGTLPLRRLFGATFAGASVLTPLCLGAVAGAVASGRVPPGNAAGDPWRSWLNPTSALGGILAVVACAHIAAVFLTADAEAVEPALVRAFRRRALMSGVLAGALAAAGIGVLDADAPKLFHGLLGRALPLVVLSGVSGLASLVALFSCRYRLARGAVALAVAAVVWGWAAGQYPYLLVPGLRIAAGSAPHATLVALGLVLLAGGALVVPSLWLLFRLAQGRLLE